jgi:hypothetical protein
MASAAAATTAAATAAAEELLSHRYQSAQPTAIATSTSER